MMTIEKIWITETEIWIRTSDGQQACEEISSYPRLKVATKKQLNNFTSDKWGIHWDELDEDLSFEGFFKEKKTSELYDIFMAHPEINVSAVARRLGMSQSLLAQYICGSKRPSAERLELIKSEIRLIGQELLKI